MKTFFRHRRHGHPVSSSPPAWYRGVLTDGTPFYSPERRSKRKIILAAAGYRHPLPGELAKALESHPEANIEGDSGLLIEHDVDDSDDHPIELSGGSYNYERSFHPFPERFEPADLRKDAYHRLPGVFADLSEDIKSFLNGEATYRSLGVQYRRGILLFGPPGNGKTSLIREVLRTHLSPRDLIFFIDRIPSRHFIQVMGESLHERLKVIVIEELTATLKDSALDRVLAFLDGELSLNRCLILATTNYPEQLPGNIVDRPSRFDKLYGVYNPNDVARKALLKSYLQTDITEGEVELTAGLSAAALREVSLLMKLKNISLSTAAALLKTHQELVKREFGRAKEIGLTLSGSDLEDFDEST